MKPVKLLWATFLLLIGLFGMVWIGITWREATARIDGWACAVIFLFCLSLAGLGVAEAQDAI